MSIFLALNQLWAFQFLIIIQLLQDYFSIVFNNGAISSCGRILENALNIIPFKYLGIYFSANVGLFPNSHGANMQYKILLLNPVKQDSLCKQSANKHEK